MSILSVVIPGIAALLGVLVPQVFMHRKNRAESHKTESEALSIDIANMQKLDAILGQVKNSHKSNMREDLDNLIYLQRQSESRSHKHEEDLAALHADFINFRDWTERHMGQVTKKLDANSKALQDYIQKPPGC